MNKKERCNCEPYAHTKDEHWEAPPRRDSEHEAPPKSEKACEQHDHDLPCPFCLNAQDDKERKRKADLFPQLVEALEKIAVWQSRIGDPTPEAKIAKEALRQAKQTDTPSAHDKGEGNE